MGIVPWIKGVNHANHVILGCAFQLANSCTVYIYTYPPASSNVAMGSKWMLEYVSLLPGASINMPRFHQFSSQVFSFPLEGGWWFPSAWVAWGNPASPMVESHPKSWDVKTTVFNWWFGFCNHPLYQVWLSVQNPGTDSITLVGWERASQYIDDDIPELIINLKLLWQLLLNPNSYWWLWKVTIWLWLT